jgi:two-component system phosphate regulon sensor histidine kinase PhoR
VTDDGPGIAFADWDRVFERFYRGDRARGGAGTGLGLAIAKHIVEAHGGQIWVAEREIGDPGAQLTFTLPRANDGG